MLSDIENFLIFGGPLPDLTKDWPEVPLPEGFYICLVCKATTNYWKPGEVCPKCEYETERQMEQERGN